MAGLTLEQLLPHLVEGATVTVARSDTMFEEYIMICAYGNGEILGFPTSDTLRLAVGETIARTTRIDIACITHIDRVGVHTLAAIHEGTY